MQTQCIVINIIDKTRTDSEGVRQPAAAITVLVPSSTGGQQPIEATYKGEQYDQQLKHGSKALLEFDVNHQTAAKSFEDKNYASSYYVFKPTALRLDKDGK